MAERKLQEERRMAKAQRYSEVLRNQEKRYTVGKSWRMSFDYATHRNVREFMPFMREMIKQVHHDAHTVRLSHYDATSLMNVADGGG